MSQDGPLFFDDFELDHRQGELRRLGVSIQLEPQVLDLIACLVAHTGQVLSRDDLIEKVWHGRIVSESAISTRINAARTALGDDGTAQRYIRTIPKRGFRFEAEVLSVQKPTPVATHSGRPTIAVLPFENMSGDPEQTYFSDGITDDIITDLSRYGELFVVARHSSFSFRERDLPLPDIADALGVQYIVEGSVRRAANRIRVSAQLSDPGAGRQLWAERYDREIADIFELQDEIGAVIVNTLAGQIARQHHQRALTKHPDAVDAYDLFLRASDLNLKLAPDETEIARTEAWKSLEIDPGFARAHALISWTYISETSNAWADDPVAALDKAKDHAEKAVSSDPRDPYCRIILGWVHMWRDGNFERGLAEQRRAIELNPGNSQSRSHYAFSLSYGGHSEEAIEILQESMRLNPYYPELFHVFYGRALFNLRRHEDALLHLERIRTTMPGHANALAHAAACYAALGRMEDATQTVAETLAASPRYGLSHVNRHVPYALAEEKLQYVECLARAGLPD